MFGSVRFLLPNKRLVFFFILSLAFVSCTKSGALTGGSAGSGSLQTLSGSVNGGLSPVIGATVSLYKAGTFTPLASATTSSTGTFNLAYTAPSGTGLFYLIASGGNAGSGTNSKVQLMTILGTSASSFPSSATVNELTTAAAMMIAVTFEVYTDSTGTVTLNAAANNLANITPQFYNLVTSNGQLVSGLSTTLQNEINATADALAACVETNGNCTSLFNAAQSSSGGPALSMLEADRNAILNSADQTATYNVALPFSGTTGFPMSSSGPPSGFSFGFPLPVVTNIYSVGTNPDFAALDASGNLWVGDSGTTTVTELNSSGSVIGTFSAGTNPQGLAIDASGNVWVADFGGSTVTELNSSGSTIGTFSVGDAPFGVVIDQSGNVWVGNRSSGSITKLSSSGSTLGTFTGITAPNGLAIDSSGNVWVGNCSCSGGTGSTVTELNSSGTILRTTVGGVLASNLQSVVLDASGNVYVSGANNNIITKLNSSGVVISNFSSGGSTIIDMAIDSVSGNFWITNNGSTTVTLYNPSLAAIGNYSVGSSGPIGVIIDSSGNVWTENRNSNTVSKLVGAGLGPSFFPYLGPIFPGSN